MSKSPTPPLPTHYPEYSGKQDGPINAARFRANLVELARRHDVLYGDIGWLNIVQLAAAEAAAQEMTAEDIHEWVRRGLVRVAK